MDVPIVIRKDIRPVVEQSATFQRWKEKGYFHRPLVTENESHGWRVMPFTILHMCVIELSVSNENKHSFMAKIQPIRLCDVFFGHLRQKHIPQSVQAKEDSNSSSDEKTAVESSYSTRMAFCRSVEKQRAYESLVRAKKPSDNDFHRKPPQGKMWKSNRWCAAENDSSAAGMVRTVGFALNFHVTIVAMFFAGKYLGEAWGMSRGGAVVCGAACALLAFVVEGALFVLHVVKSERNATSRIR